MPSTRIVALFEPHTSRYVDNNNGPKKKMALRLDESPESDIRLPGSYLKKECHVKKRIGRSVRDFDERSQKDYQKKVSLIRQNLFRVSLDLLVNL